jgi:predicted aspartyl protease
MSIVSPAIALALAAIAMPAVHSSSGQDAGDTDIVATNADVHDRMTVSLRIGERGPYRFLLDTGAENTVVSSLLAQELALPRGGNATIVGVAGRQSVPTVELEEIFLGKRSYAGLSAALLERTHIGADGILGLDTLQNQRVLLDFSRNLIAIDDAQALGGNRGFEIVVRARRRSGQLVVTNAEIDGVRTDVVIDTGADFSIGNRALQRALGQRAMGRRMVQDNAVLSSVTGQEIAAQIGVARTLTIDRIGIANVAIAFTDAPPFAALKLEQRPALLLGMRELRSFKRVAIDFSSRRVLFDLRPGS